MNCPKCGTENGEGVQVCQSCGGVVEYTSPAVAVDQAKTSGLAIASLICGILSGLTCFLTALPAVILGVISLVKINKSQGKQKGLGLAIAGIALPVALVPVVFMLLAILMPALGRAKMVAERVVCGTNMKDLSSAIMVYQYDYDDKYPTGSQWNDLLMTHADVGEKSYICPSAQRTQPGRCHYALNANALRLGSSAPADMVLMFESKPGWNQAGGPELLADHHQGEGGNFLFVDGHVSFERAENIPNLRWTE